MNLKVSQLPQLPTEDVSSNDKLAVAVWQGDRYPLRQLQVDHKSANIDFGEGNGDYYGHIKLTDTYIPRPSIEDDYNHGTAASTILVKNTHDELMNKALSKWVGTQEEWDALPDDEKAKYKLINILEPGSHDPFTVTIKYSVQTVSTSDPYILRITKTTDGSVEYQSEYSHTQIRNLPGASLNLDNLVFLNALELVSDHTPLFVWMLRVQSEEHPSTYKYQWDGSSDQVNLHDTFIVNNF